MHTVNRGGKILVAILVLLLMQFDCPALAANSDADIDIILSSAESLFKSMKDREYARIWQQLSIKSRAEIVESVFKATGRNNGKYSSEAIDRDFTEGAELSKSYWNSYLDNFDPDTVLKQSKWEIGAVSDGYAEIRVTFRKAAAPAVLKMFKQDGRWKVGLIETFGAKK